MATVNWKGWAKPDDPIYQGGAVVGGKRFYNTSKTAKPKSKPKEKKESVPGERTEREEIWFDLQAEPRLLDRITAQIAAKDDEAFQAVEDAYMDDLTRRWPDISKEEADELQWYKEQK